MLKPEDFPHVMTALATHPSGTLVTKEALAQMWNKAQISIDRAIERGELPPPVKMFGKLTWTVDHILQWIDDRLKQAAKEREEQLQKLQRLQLPKKV